VNVILILHITFYIAPVKKTKHDNFHSSDHLHIASSAGESYNNKKSKNEITAIPIPIAER
jgi:hypothetical protein